MAKPLGILSLLDDESRLPKVREKKTKRFFILEFRE
jgi:myosin heavy subunit